MPPVKTLAALCAQTLAQHVSRMDDVGFVSDHLLSEILVSATTRLLATPGDLARIADATLRHSGRDVSTVTEPLWEKHVARMGRMQHCTRSSEDGRWHKIKNGGGGGGGGGGGPGGARADGGGGGGGGGSSSASNNMKGTATTTRPGLPLSYREAFEWETAQREKRKEAAAARLRGHYGGAVHVESSLPIALESPLNLKCDILVSKFAFKLNLYRYTTATRRRPGSPAPWEW
jgi:hypothetical protein